MKIGEQQIMVSLSRDYLNERAWFVTNKFEVNRTTYLTASYANEINHVNNIPIMYIGVTKHRILINNQVINMRDPDSFEQLDMFLTKAKNGELYV